MALFAKCLMASVLMSAPSARRMARNVTWSAAFTSLLEDVEAKLFARLPDETWFSPGHGADSTLGRERPQLAVWRARDW